MSTTESMLNNFTGQIVSQIDLHTNYRFINIEQDKITLCQTNLVNYLEFFIEKTSNLDKDTDDIELILAEKLDELLGQSVVGKHSDLMKDEARYHIRLFWLSDRLMLSLIKILNMYNSNSLTDKFKAMNSFLSLVMLNSYFYKAGAATQKPVFGFNTHSDINQRNVETCIQFLIRNMCEMNLYGVEVPEDYSLLEVVLLMTINSPFEEPMAAEPVEEVAAVTKDEIEEEEEEGVGSDEPHKEDSIGKAMFHITYLIVFVGIGIALMVYSGGHQKLLR